MKKSFLLAAFACVASFSSKAADLPASQNLSPKKVNTYCETFVTSGYLVTCCGNSLSQLAEVECEAIWICCCEGGGSSGGGGGVWT